MRVLVATALLALAACRLPASLSPEELGRLGARIAAYPERTDELLEEAGLRREEFSAAVRELAMRPDSVARYRRAYVAEQRERTAVRPPRRRP